MGQKTSIFRRICYLSDVTHRLLIGGHVEAFSNKDVSVGLIVGSSSNVVHLAPGEISYLSDSLKCSAFSSRFQDLVEIWEKVRLVDNYDKDTQIFL